MCFFAYADIVVTSALVTWDHAKFCLFIHLLVCFLLVPACVRKSECVFVGVYFIPPPSVPVIY